MAQAGIRGRDEVAVIGTHTDVAGCGMHITARKQRGTHPADFFAQGAGHDGVCNKAKALVKKSTVPKLPDFNAMS